MLIKKKKTLVGGLQIFNSTAYVVVLKLMFDHYYAVHPVNMQCENALSNMNKLNRGRIKKEMERTFSLVLGSLV